MDRPLAIALCGLALTSAPLLSRAAEAGEALAAKAGCGMCHAADRKGIGPSYRDIAARHKGDPQARALLTERVRKGSSGNWGRIPMAPVGPTRINDENLSAVVDWMLKQ